MSRFSRSPLSIPEGVDVDLNDGTLTVKGAKGSLCVDLPALVEMQREDSSLRFRPRGGGAKGEALAGTARAMLRNMVHGVTQGFERRLQLVGVGYRAQVKDRMLSLALGYSHPVEYRIPEDISIEAPSPTEIVVRGIDKQRVGQTAAIIRGFRPPEPYKGKGVRYADEAVMRKEAKKK